MSDDIDDILSNDQPAPEAQQPEPEPTPAEPAEPVEAEPVEAEQAPEQPPEPEKPMVPLAALQEVRDQNRELKGAIDALQKQTQPQPQKAPDFIDPEGAAYIGKQMQQMQAHMVAEISEAKARANHGGAVVDAALKAAQDAGRIGEFAGRQDAWGDLVAWHKREQVLSEVGDDPAAYRAKIEAEVRKQVEAEMVAKQAQAAQPAPSLANVTSTNKGAAPSGDGTWKPASLSDLLG